VRVSYWFSCWRTCRKWIEIKAKGKERWRIMKTLAKKATPAAIAVLRQATAIAPLRMKASDGLLPSQAHIHQNPNSDHNTGLAVDLTHDPKHGIDCVDIFEKLKEDKRVEYLILKGKILLPV
jgi:hypothetical protein